MYSHAVGVHKNAIVHRDINSRNILVRSNMTCAIADMGFSLKIKGSKVIKNGVEEHAEDGSLRDVSFQDILRTDVIDYNCAVLGEPEDYVGVSTINRQCLEQAS